MQSFRFSIIFTFVFTFTSLVYAERLPEGHLLAPRDLEPLTLNGIERLGGNNFWKKKLDKCNDNFFHMACSLKEGILKSKSSHKFFKEHTFADMTFFGETHTKPVMQMVFAQLIKNINDKKVRALGLEMFNETSQPMINQYLTNLITLEELIKVLESEWNYKSSGYKEIIKVAKEKGLHIIALDNRPEFRYRGLGVGLLERDKVMAKNLIDYKTEFPDNKIIVYTGKLHAFRSLSEENRILTISEMVEQTIEGLSRESYLFFEKTSFSPPTVVRNIMQPEIQEDIVIEVSDYRHYIDGLILLK